MDAALRCTRWSANDAARARTQRRSGIRGGRIAMAIALGTENKRQVYIVIALAAFIVCFGGWELYSYISGPATPAHPAVPRSASAGGAGGIRSTPTAAPEAQRLSGPGLDPNLHLDKLAQSEDV